MDKNRDYGLWADMLLGEWTGLYDKNDRKVMYGDWLSFDAREWGAEGYTFEVLYNPRDGVSHAGDIDQWCEVIETPAQSHVD